MLRWVKHTPILFLLTVMLLFPLALHGQFFRYSEEPINIEAKFARHSIQAAAKQSFFNTLKVKNNSNRTENITLNITIPQGWKVIGEEKIELQINPNDSLLIPLRVAVGGDVRGDIGYSVIASFSDSRGNTIKNEYCFVKIPRKTDLRVRFVDRILYIDPISETSSFSVLVKNNGNRDEPVNFLLDGNNYLGIGSQSNFRHSKDVVISPYSDSLITFNVALRTQDDFGRINYGLNATISTMDTTLSSTVWFRKLESRLLNQVPQKEKVLVADIVGKGLLDANKKPIVSATLEGKVLFKGDKDVYYYYRNFSSKEREDLYINNRMHIGGNIGNWQLELGDNYRSFESNMFGRGGYLAYNGKDLKVEALANKDKRTETINYGGIGNYYFTNTDYLTSGATYSSNTENNFESLMALAGGGLSFFNNHNVQGLFAYNQIRRELDGQNQHNEFGGELRYGSKFGNFDNSLRARYASPLYYGPQAGRLRVYANTRYQFNSKHRLSLYLIESRVNRSNIQNNITIRSTQSQAREAKVEHLFQASPTIQVYGGPAVENYIWEGLANFIEDKHFGTLGYKMYLGARIKNSTGTIAIAPKYEVARVNVLSNPFVTDDMQSEDMWFNYQYFSLNFRSRRLNVLAFYTSGPKSVMDQINYTGFSKPNRRLQFMPSFDGFVYKNILRAYAGLSYANDVVTGSTYSNLTGQLQWYLPKNWVMHSLAVYSIQSRTTAQDLVEKYQNFYLEVGVKKEFNIDQPRVRYHDVELLFFKDFNGNYTQEPNEPGIKNILVNINKEGSDVVGKIPGDLFSAELLSDHLGRVVLENVPEGRYKFTYNPIGGDAGTFSKALGDIEIKIEREGKYYFPFVEKNKVFGKIVLNRSRLSGLGNIDVSNVRVTATDSQGRSFSTLTDKNGEFVLFAPITDEYIVSINNIFYENFDLRQNNFLVQFNGYKQFEVNFVFDEKVRRINFAESDSDRQGGVQQVRRTTISGTVKDANTQQPVRAKINLINSRTNSIVTSTNSSATSGEYTMNFMASDSYVLEVLADDYWYMSENLALQQLTTFMNVNRDVMLKPVSVGSRLGLNIQFDSGSAHLTPESVAELNRLVRQLKDNPTVRIEVQGYADELEVIDNPDIGKQRAGAVAKYVIENGFSNLEVKDMGAENPVATNDTPEGRVQNRRIEVVVVGR
ncbi:MAG: OmpA family protein [Bacteroidales bacterium]